MNNRKERFELFRIFQDGMILQRNTSVKIWGFADPGLKIGMEFLESEYEAVTGDDGEFAFDIQTGEAGGPYVMKISSDAGVYELKDILLGDVYLLNGQSNMELQVGRILDHVGKEPETMDYPEIREFRAPIRPAFGEVKEQFEEGRWLVARKEDIYDMSAVGTYFAKYVQESEHIPIGLINVSVGGTPIEAHIPEEELRQYKVYDAEMEKNKDKEYVASTERSDMERIEDWYRRLDERDEGYAGGELPYAKPEYDDESWDRLVIPKHFRGTDLDHFIGTVWFRYEFDVPKDYPVSEDNIMLRLGAIIDADRTYVNGVMVGFTEYMYPPRRYELPAGTLKHGKNVLAVRLIINRNCGGFVSGKEYTLTWADGRKIDLAGEWRYKKAAVMEELTLQTFFCYKPSAIYNGMIYPILKCSFTGSLWYQGESNENNAAEYAKLMRHLIRCYREWFGKDFPFYYVQLPQFDDPAGFVGKDAWALIREQQREVLDVDNTAMAVTIDIGESNDLHPQLKPEVAYRLYLCAEALIYGRDVEYSGPTVREAAYDSAAGEIRIRFDHCKGGLVLKNTNDFEVCEDEEEGVWTAADEVIVVSAAIIIRLPQNIKKAAAIRYCYSNCPKAPAIYNKAGLPASPFVYKL